MKKVFCLIVVVLTLVSCEKFCPRCGNYETRCYCNKGSSGYYNSYNDYFCADKLIGTWQMDYNIGYYNGLGAELKSIQFFNNHKCDITYEVPYDPTWWTDTYTYTYTSGYIKFSKERSSFSFKVRGYLFPELYLQDSFGNYTWRRVR